MNNLILDEAKLSSKEVAWQALVFIAIAYTAFEAPYSYVFKTSIYTWQVVIDGLVSVVFLADLYYQLKMYTKHRRSDRARQHFPTNRILFISVLCIDLIACIPFDLMSWMLKSEGATLFQFLRLIRLIRMVRIITILNHLTFVPKQLKMSFLVVCALISIHLIACSWIHIYPPSNGISDQDYYVQSLYWAVTTLTTIGYGDITPTSNAGRLFTMVIMILGVGVYGIVIGNVANMLQNANRYKAESKEKLQDMMVFMKHYNIPLRLQQAVFNYYKHLLTKRLSDNDHKIIAELPHALQQDLQTYMNIKLIASVPVFKGCSHACLKQVASSLEQMYFSPGENIIQIGELGNEMYIIGHGVVEVILKDASVVAKLHEGQFFGEIALLQETTRTANVRAQTYCDLYKLAKEDFLEIIKSHPELRESIERITHKRSNESRRNIKRAA